MSRNSLGSFRFNSSQEDCRASQSSSSQIRHPFHKFREMSGSDAVRSQARDNRDSRLRDSRSSLLDKFRNISLNGSRESQEGVDLEDDMIDDHMSDDNVFVATQQEDADDWGDPSKDKPSVDLRQFNFNLPGILCPYCRANMMNTVDQKAKLAVRANIGAVTEYTASHVCPCGFELEVSKTCDQIKGNIMTVLSEHQLNCPSDQSPHYTLYSDNIVLSCNSCNLARIVS